MFKFFIAKFSENLMKWSYKIENSALQTHHVDFTLKRRGNGRFHIVSTWNPRGVFVGWQPLRIVRFFLPISHTCGAIKPNYRTLPIVAVTTLLLGKSCGLNICHSCEECFCKSLVVYFYLFPLIKLYACRYVM